MGGTDGEADADTDRIVNLIRLPRTIVTVLVGANLALAGCNLQACCTIRWQTRALSA